MPGYLRFLGLGARIYVAIRALRHQTRPRTRERNSRGFAYFERYRWSAQHRALARKREAVIVIYDLPSLNAWKVGRFRPGVAKIGIRLAPDLCDPDWLQPSGLDDAARSSSMPALTRGVLARRDTYGREDEPCLRLSRTGLLITPAKFRTLETNTNAGGFTQRPQSARNSANGWLATQFCANWSQPSFPDNREIIREFRPF